jgi:DNA mismatch repair protein mutS
MRRSEVDIDKLSPMMRQYIEIKKECEDCIVFYRLGDFYEMFFEDAIIASRELELTLTGKQAGLEERVPMCGVPHHSYASYVEKLIDKDYKVAIVEQLEDPKTTKDTVKRGVVQIITKGTKMDSLEASDNNFIGNIYMYQYAVGISLIDVSTGEVYITILDNDNDIISKYLAKKNVLEVIVSSSTDRNLVNILRTKYNIIVTITDNLLDDKTYDYIYEDIEDNRLVTTLKHLLFYIIENKKGDMHHLQKAILLKSSNYLEFDNNTKRNLELTETLRRKERTYSLFWLLDKCKTAMGSRFLKETISSPLTDKKEIIRRYDIVSLLSTEFILRDELIKALDNVYDLERLTGRISYGNLNAKDLLQLKTSLEELPNIKRILKELKYDKEINTYDELTSLLEKAIREDAPFTLKEGRLIKQGYNKELDELKEISSGSKDFILKLEQEERERTGIKTLKVGFNKIFGYYIEVSKSFIKDIKEEFGYDRKQTLANCERYTTKLLKEKENIILGAEDKIINLEYKLFMDIREVVKRYIKDLQKTSKTLCEIDMLQAFSVVSDEYKYTRPQITDENKVKLIESRHPVVEKVLNNNYVSNDIVMDNNTSILLITGPNMAGKSTYMRQMAITVIMAQMGCFVPAKEARLPIFDKIFTRIGASDDLVSGSSTFMIEMEEANYAIANATDKSLILFDELGRGTATYDGMSLAEAILEYIHNNIKAKTMFSTHYHELTNLEKKLKHLKNVHVSAVEEDGKITFLHKIKNGSVDKSYGIHVASLANLPKELINNATKILNQYENKKTKVSNFEQTTLFEEKELDKEENKLEEKLKEIDPLYLTPIDALNLIFELKKELKQNK